MALRLLPEIITSILVINYLSSNLQSICNNRSSMSYSFVWIYVELNFGITKFILYILFNLGYSCRSTNQNLIIKDKLIFLSIIFTTWSIFSGDNCAIFKARSTNIIAFSNKSLHNSLNFSLVNLTLISRSSFISS